MKHRLRSFVAGLAVAAPLLLSACSDKPTEISPPGIEPVRPEASVALGCVPDPTAASLLTMINGLLPRSPIRTSLIALVAALPQRRQDRIKAVVRRLIFPIQDLVFRAFYAGRLTGGTSAASFDRVLRFSEALHCYVGLTPPVYPTTTGAGEGDIVVGVVFPNSPTTTLAVPSAHAAVTIPQGAAREGTTIVVRNLPDSPGQLLTSLDQYPLFYEFSGTTATGPATFNLDVTAGVCLKDILVGVPPGNLRLAHNVAPFKFGNVEILPLAAVVPGVDCNNLPNTSFLNSSDRSFAGSIQRVIEPLFRAVLPDPLHATSLAFTTLRVGGTTKKFSPFGVVDILSNPGGFAPVGPTESTEEGGPVTRTVRVTSANEEPIANVPVAFEPGEGSGTVSEDTVFTDANGEASVSWGVPSTPGVYTLEASVPFIDNPPAGTKNPPPGTLPPSNVASFPDVRFDPQSVTFTATVPSSEEPLVLNVATVEKLPGGTQHFAVQSGAPGPYIWSVNGVDGGNATFGTVVTNADFTAEYTAPGAVPSPATFDVCARRQADPSNSACASVTIQPVPSSGADVIVFNDINMFDNIAASDLNNVQLFRNLVNFSATGPRASGGSVLIHLGHGSQCSDPGAQCTATWTTFVSTMSGEGYSVTYADDQTPLTTIGSDVKVVILALPTLAYSNAEINSLKAFAGEGGRIVFVGEHDAFYLGIPIENDFLVKMGAEMRNTGGFIDCGYTVIPQSRLQVHQVTAGLTQLTIACASIVDPGPNDYTLFSDVSGNNVLGAVAKVSLTPLAGLVREPGASIVEEASAKAWSAVRSSDPAGRELRSRERDGRSH